MPGYTEEMNELCNYTEDIESYDYAEEENRQYNDSTYDVVSKVAYLIGVPKSIFENEHEPPVLEIYRQLDQQKNARIIRNLCRVRTAIERSFGRINGKMRTEYRSIFSLPEYIPEDAIIQLSNDGIQFRTKSTSKLSHYIIEINGLISDRINNCKSIFPEWLNWNYIRDMFIMKDGLTENGTKVAASIYYPNKHCYPYFVYINWSPQENGNILYNDKKFVTLLYQWNNDYFTDFSKVSDACSYVKHNIFEFVDSANKIVISVDCENSDPYRLCAALKSLDQETASKIQKIMLIDDVHTVDAWGILKDHTSIPVEHIMTERVKEDKSLVDIELTAITCREHYKNDVDSFILVSSDSDFWGLISTLPDAKFLVMVEREKCGPNIKQAFFSNGIFYCYIDDFYTGNGEDIKKNALFRELYRSLDNALHLNAKTMLQEALTATRIDMKPAEQKQFYDKYMRNMRLIIDDEGNASLELNT